MPIVAPARDPGFANHPVHGIAGQRASFLVAASLCKQFRTAIDVGAHIGLWTRLMAGAFNTVFAYECVFENYSCLLENTAGYDNVRTQQVAIGDVVGWCKAELPPAANSGCWFAKPDENGEVPMLTLEPMFNEDVDLIKIDVEGAEGSVLRGAGNLLRRSRPVVVFEDNGLGPKHYGDSWIDPKAILTDAGYKHARRVRKDEIWLPS